MRAVVVLVVVLFSLAMVQLFASAAVEPVGEEVKDWVPDKYDSTINSVYDAVFKWSILIFGGGMMVWALRWYIRRERFVGRRPP